MLKDWLRFKAFWFWRYIDNSLSISCTFLLYFYYCSLRSFPNFSFFFFNSLIIVYNCFLCFLKFSFYISILLFIKGKLATLSDFLITILDADIDSSDWRLLFSFARLSFLLLSSEFYLFIWSNSAVMLSLLIWV